MEFTLLSDNLEVNKHNSGKAVAAIMWLVKNYGCSHLHQNDYYGGALFYPDNIESWEKWAEVGNKIKDSDEWVWFAETSFKYDQFYAHWRKDIIKIRDESVALLFQLKFGDLIAESNN